MAKQLSSEVKVTDIKIKNSELHAWENVMINTHGWYVHLIPSTVNKDIMDIHTHGIKESFGHDDFQIVAPLPDITAQSIFASFIDRIKAGEKFVNNQIVSKIIGGYEVKLVNAIESDRIVLRIILPDKYGKLDIVSIESPFHLQYADLITNVMVH